MLQTTNNILDASLYRLLTPRTLTSWQRVRAANMLSATGAVACANLHVGCRANTSSSTMCTLRCGIFIQVVTAHLKVLDAICPVQLSRLLLQGRSGRLSWTSTSRAPATTSTLWWTYQNFALARCCHFRRSTTSF